MEKAEKHGGNLFAGQLVANGSYAKIWTDCLPAKPFLERHPHSSETLSPL